LGINLIDLLFLITGLFGNYSTFDKGNSTTFETYTNPTAEISKNHY